MRQTLTTKTLTFVLLPLACAGVHAATCHPASDAGRYMGKNVCLTAHVYNIAQLRDGTRFLDTCRPDTKDEDCRFTIATLPEDTRDVGDLNTLVGKDIQLHGTVHEVNERAFMYLTRSQQLHGGSEKFHPNPALLTGFSAESGKAPVHDPSLSGNHHFSLFRATH